MGKVQNHCSDAHTTDEMYGIEKNVFPVCGSKEISEIQDFCPEININKENTNT